MSSQAVVLAGLHAIAEGLGEQPDPVLSIVDSAFSPIYATMSAILLVFVTYAIVRDILSMFGG